jgi:5-methylthioadenosine/S-adenosylhomocysteine deaminase
MRLAADLTLVGRRFEEGRVVDVDGGRIAGIQSLPPHEAHSADLVRLPGKALLPGTVNTHCHTFQSLLRGLGDDLYRVRGRPVVRSQRLTTLDQDGLMERVRALTRDWAPA